MMFTIKSFKISGALQAVSEHANRAGRHRRKTVVKGVNVKRNRPASVPVRGRMLRQVLEGRTPGSVRIKRAMYCYIVFAIVGGAIALFIAGAGINSGFWAMEGLVAAFFCGLAGAAVGYFSGRR
jgi:hypothetical protein